MTVDPYAVGYAQGVADASARLIGVVAARLGDTDPIIDTMVLAIGRLIGDDRYDEVE